MSNTYKVVYVGSKPFTIDNVAKSGKSWNGNGDVQEVTAAQAKILISYADQWALAEGQSDEGLDAPKVITTDDGQGGLSTTDESELSIHFEKMTATQLAAYAKDKHGKELNIKRGRKVLLDEVIALEGNFPID